MTRNSSEGARMGHEAGRNAGTSGGESAERGYAAWLDVFHANTLMVRALEKALKREFELPLVGYEVLVKLEEVPEGERLRMQELARRVLLSKSGLSQLFTRLEKRGLVARRGDPDNLRVTYAILTAEGRKMLERVLPTCRGEIEERFARHLDEEETLTVRRAMGKVIRAFGEEPLSQGAKG